MNPSDDEVVKEEKGQTPEEIEDLLEPQAIPDERIVRHAETNDSYREAPSLGNDEEIVQPPLEPEEETEPENEQIVEEVPVVEELAEVEDIQAPLSDMAENIPVITQEEMMHPQISSVSNSETEPVIIQEVVEPVPPRIIPEPEVAPVLTQATAPHSQVNTTDGATQYHTVSGGPETIHDLMSGKLHDAHSGDAPVSSIHPTESSASGYTIPNPDYVSPPHVNAEEQSSFGSWFFLVILAIIGGAGTYLYFFMPETFDQLYDAVFVIFNSLTK